MVYKSQKEKYQAIVQFVGDCITKEGMKKNAAVKAAMKEFNILTEATVYRSLRRCVEIHQKDMEVQNG